MWWRKRKEMNEEGSDGVGLRLLKGYRYLQHHWARFMATLVQGWSVRKQKTLLLIVLLPAAVYCARLVYNGVTGKEIKIEVKQIETGGHIGLPKIDSTKINK